MGNRIKHHLDQSGKSEEHQHYIQMIKENISNRLLNHRGFDNQVRIYQQYYVTGTGSDSYGPDSTEEHSRNGPRESFIEEGIKALEQVVSRMFKRELKRKHSQ